MRGLFSASDDLLIAVCVPAELVEAHKTRPEALGTVLIKHVSPAQAKDCGEVVADPATKEMLHYTERPVSPYNTDPFRAPVVSCAAAHAVRSDHCCRVHVRAPGKPRGCS